MQTAALTKDDYSTPSRPSPRIHVKHQQYACTPARTHAAKHGPPPSRVHRTRRSERGGWGMGDLRTPDTDFGRSCVLCCRKIVRKRPKRAANSARRAPPATDRRLTVVAGVACVVARGAAQTERGVGVGMESCDGGGVAPLLLQHMIKRKVGFVRAIRTERRTRVFGTDATASRRQRAKALSGVLS